MIMPSKDKLFSKKEMILDIEWSKKT